MSSDKTERKEVPIIFEDSDDEQEVILEEISSDSQEVELEEEKSPKEKEKDDGSMWFHEKGKFTLHGFTMYDVLITQEQFQYVEYFKRSVLRIDLPEGLSEKWRHPLIGSMRDRIENEYGMKVKGVFGNHYEKEGNDYAPYHKDSYGDGKGVFTVSIGGTRMFYTKDDKTGVVTKHKLDDGDLFYFNSQFNSKHKHSIPKLKSYKDPRISIVFFV
ncbi:MAG: hypothetical protein PHG66_01730 [Candidatus Colwellbacteria bacterium]|nr:hypothetical protein [Candidatus Colwellbacteria bacterium]